MSSQKPKFQVGDRVLKKKTGKVHTILDCIYFKPVATHAIRVDGNGKVVSEPTTISGRYQYKIDDGRNWRHAESTLELT